MGVRGIRRLGVAALLVVAFTGCAEAAHSAAKPPARVFITRKADQDKDAALSSRFTAGIVTGTPQSTEFAVTQDIATTLAAGQETGPHGEVALRVLPMVGNGGARDIADLLALPGADMAMVPTVMVDRLRAEGTFGDLSRKIAYIAVLFPEQFHLLVKPEIKTLSDLAGKTLSLGEPGGAAAVLGLEMLNSLGLKPKIVNLGLAEALDGMRAGTVDGALVVAAKPVDAVAHYAQLGALRLLPIPYSDALGSGYEKATITHADYPTILGVDEKIDTVAVRAALYAYAWPRRSPRYALLESFVQTLFSRFPDFLKPPHPAAWLQVDLAATLSGWKRFAPAEDWLKEHGDDGSVLRAPPEEASGPQPARTPLFPDTMRR